MKSIEARKNDGMTHRERVLAALDHKPVDRVPVSMVGSYINPAPRKALEVHLQQTRGIGVDAFLSPIVDLKAVCPAYIGPPLPAGTDFWGVQRATVQAGHDQYDEITSSPLATAQTVDDIMAHAWPRHEWFDYESIPRQIEAIRAEGDYAIWLYGPGNIFESAWYMRGFEQMFIDMFDSPEFADTLMRKVTDFYVEHLRRALEAADGMIDLDFTGDDIAGQRGPLISHSFWEKLIKPHHMRLNKLIHEFGVRVIYHSDGAVTEFVPGLIDMGIDVLESLQFDADGMDPEALKAQYGTRLCFAGGLSVQHTLPFGSVHDVREEARNLIRVLGKDGGYLFGPSHAIQAGTPPENIVAMFEAPFSQQNGGA